MCVHYFTLCVHYFCCWELSTLSRDFSVFLCVFTIFLCVFTISAGSWLSTLSRHWASCLHHHFLHEFLQEDTCISPRWYMYFSRMIHGFVTITCTISVGSCLPWAVIELAVRPTCSQNLEDVEVTLQFFLLHVCIYSFMQQCKYAQHCTMSCNSFHFSPHAATNCYQHVTHCVVKFVFT